MGQALAIDRLGDRLYAGLLSLGVHLIALGLILLGAWWQERSPTLSVAGEPIEAVIWTGPVPGQAPPPPAAARPRPAPPPPPERRPDTRDQEKAAALTPAPTPERARQEQRERRAQPRQADLDAARRALEEDRRRQEELARLRAEREHAERQARLEQERLRQLADLAAAAPQPAPESRPAPLPGNQGRDESLAARYALAIQQLVTSNWLRPEHVRPGLSCRLRIIQIPGGEVISAEVLAPCNADEITRRSIEAAVLRAQPLPYRGFESVFQREIVFNFRYEG
ncbi:MAG: protein TolA [Xanthomonadales bacterium]|nr:protein TolA [Xanthomonadales bacterium]